MKVIDTSFCPFTIMIQGCFVSSPEKCFVGPAGVPVIIDAIKQRPLSLFAHSIERGSYTFLPTDLQRTVQNVQLPHRSLQMKLDMISLYMEKRKWVVLRPVGISNEGLHRLIGAGRFWRRAVARTSGI